jgi:hypothetical protein
MECSGAIINSMELSPSSGSSSGSTTQEFLSTFYGTPMFIVRLEGLDLLQIARTSLGIEPATFQLVA